MDTIDDFVGLFKNHRHQFQHIYFFYMLGTLQRAVERQENQYFVVVSCKGTRLAGKEATHSDCHW